jgi:hypothetical protein
MDIGSALTALTVIGTGLGSFAGGRLSGKGSASQIAADTVDMLQAQVDVLKEEKNSSHAELASLRARVDVLEGLVTQRAEVDELGAKISLVKETVDKIAIRVGA